MWRKAGNLELMQRGIFYELFTRERASRLCKWQMMVRWMAGHIIEAKTQNG